MLRRTEPPGPSFPTRTLAPDPLAPERHHPNVHTINTNINAGGNDDDDLVQSVLEFLEVAVHTVLWSRSLYSQDLFERVRYCGFNARRSRHPGLNAYIGSVVAKLKQPLKSRALEELAIVFFHPQGTPLERLTFSIKLDPVNSAGPAWDLSALQSSFTSSLLVLTCTDSLCRPLPPGSTFELLAYCSSRAPVDMSFFFEDSSGTAELSQRQLTAQPLNSFVLQGCLAVQVLLEQQNDSFRTASRQ